MKSRQREASMKLVLALLFSLRIFTNSFMEVERPTVDAFESLNRSRHFWWEFLSYFQHVQTPYKWRQREHINWDSRPFSTPERNLRNRSLPSSSLFVRPFFSVEIEFSFLWAYELMTTKNTFTSFNWKTKRVTQCRREKWIKCFVNKSFVIIRAQRGGEEEEARNYCTTSTITFVSKLLIWSECCGIEFTVVSDSA